MLKISQIAAILIAVSIPAFAQAQTPVHIAMIDSGVGQTRTLRDVVVAEYDMAGTRKAYSTRNEHGTGVATVIAMNARVPVQITSMRADIEGKCARARECLLDAKAVQAAIRKAIALKVDVINISLNIHYDLQTSILLNNAANAGIMIVMAAGNERGVPAGLRFAEQIRTRMWLVGAQDQQGQPAEFSARPVGTCSCQFVWRSGVEIQTQNHKGQPETMTGTSFAAPLYTAEIASKVARVLVAAK